MAVNTAEISSVYDVYMAKHKEKLDAEFDNKRLQSDMYALPLTQYSIKSPRLYISTILTTLLKYSYSLVISSGSDTLDIL